MKKQLCMVLATTVITTLSLPAVAFADTTASTTNTNTSTSAITITAPAIVVKDMTFTTPIVKLSLNDTYKKLDTSTSMELIKNQKQSDFGIAQGYSEEAHRMGKDSNDPSSASFWTYDSSSKKMKQAMRDFAKSMIEPNNTARINKLHRDTFEQYYTLKNAETQVSIAKDNLAITQKLLTNSQLKLKLGTISKMDVLTAEMNVKTAKDSYKAAQDGLNSLKMAFNTSMNYPLMQDIALTDTINEVSLPATTLEDAIKSALTNRLELKEAAYNVQMAKLGMDNAKQYPSLSATYLNAQSAMLSAELGNTTTPKKVEMDIRTKYMSMMTAYQEVQSGKQNVSNAKETARLAQLQYDSGMTTVTTVQQANYSCYNAQLEQSKALLEYNLAVEDFKLAQGLGTAAATIYSSSN